jgi:hypothetical protein
MEFLPKLLITTFLIALCTWAWSQAGATVFYDVMIIDVRSGKLQKHQEVIVADKKIIAVRPISKKSWHRGSRS